MDEDRFLELEHSRDILNSEIEYHEKLVFNMKKELLKVLFELNMKGVEQ